MESSLITQALQQANNHSPKKMPLDNSLPQAELKSALASTKIYCINDTELLQIIAYCMMLVGLRANTIAAMTPIEKQVLLEFIRDNYSLHTVGELKLAFKKAVARELDVDATAYENFSCEYVGRIMKAYRNWAKTQYNEGGFVQKENVPAQLPPPAFNPLELVQTFYNDFLEGAANAELITARAFDIAMDKCGIVLTEKEMLKIVREARTHVVQAYEKTKQTFALERLKALPFGESCLDEYVNRYSKALALISWFEEQKNAGITNLIETYDTPQKQ